LVSFAPRIAPDVPIPPHILPTLDRLEAQAAASMLAELDGTIRRILQQSDRLLTSQDIKGILDLNQGLGIALQRPIVQLWEFAWLQGSEHAILEMQDAIPASAKRQVESYNLTDEIARLVRELLRFTPQTFRNLPAERSIQQRVLKLAGGFAKDTLDAVKAHLLSAIAPQPETGNPISRDELLKRLQSTVNVSRARAQTIARTEVGAAYNRGRLSTFSESKLVTHLIFYAIDDKRTTSICQSRAGMILPVEDKKAIAHNLPPCHYSCRSTIGSLMPQINEMHRKIVEDKSRFYSSRKLVPLLSGWRSAISK
jgi:SPP1 gp7 family putative phage head morphogenesis protein